MKVYFYDNGKDKRQKIDKDVYDYLKEQKAINVKTINKEFSLLLPHTYFDVIFKNK